MPDPSLSPTHSHLQCGAGATGFLLASVPVLLLGLGAIELGHGFKVRQVVNLALLEAARAGSTGHAHPEAIHQAFESALLPLFRGTNRTEREQSQRAAFAAREALTGRPAWQIRQLSPTASHFQTHADANLRISHDTGLPAINNNYLAEQQAMHGVQAGAASSVFQANMLALHVHYLYQPLLPGVANMLRMFGHRNGNYARHALSHGLLPLQQELAIIMQSHPVLWPATAQANVLRTDADTATQPGEPLPDMQSCHGLWCIKGNSTVAGPAYPPAPGADGAGWPAEGAGAPAAPEPPEIPVTPEAPGTEIHPRDPACGVSLCCIG